MLLVNILMRSGQSRIGSNHPQSVQHLNGTETNTMHRTDFARLEEEALALYGSSLRAPRTREKIKQALRELRSAGVQYCDQLTPGMIAIWASQHTDRSGVSSASILRAIKAIVRIAIASGYLDRDPVAWRKSWFDATPADVVRHHTRADVARVLDLLDREAREGGWREHRLRALTYLVAYTGVRRDEALLAKCVDVDLERKVFLVSRRRRLKTRSSSALLPMPRPLREVMREWLPRTRSEWLIPSVYLKGPWTGGPPGYKPLDRLAQAGERAGVSGLTFLSLRHSLGTHAGYFGLSQLELKQVLRHTNLRTQGHYRHDDLEDLWSIGDRIDYTS